MQILTQSLQIYLVNSGYRLSVHELAFIQIAMLFVIKSGRVRISTDDQLNAFSFFILYFF